MELSSLAGLPQVVAPSGYRIRTYRESDAGEWCRLIGTWIGGEYDANDFRQSVGGSSGFDPEGLFFAENDEGIVGTACAIWSDEFADDTGYVHMVAVDADHRGRGLGRVLTLAVLHRLRDRGYTRAVLQTDDVRLPAIRVYLSLDFRPRLTHESHEARWLEVRRNLGATEGSS